MDYSDKIFSSLKIKGRIWESQYPHFVIGLKAFGGLKNNSRILDIGCGAGGLTALWQEKFPNFIFEGIDVSKKAIKLAKECYPGIKFATSSAESIGKTSKKYDAISVCELIEHVNDPEKVLNNIYKILNNNGILYLTTQLEADEATLTGKIYGMRGIKPKEKIVGHIQAFDRKAIKSLVKKSGFKIIEIYYNCHFLGQVIDLLYLVNLKKNGKNVLSLTDYLEKSSGIKRDLGYIGMEFVASVRNIETAIFKKNVGLGIQIIAQKV